MLEMSKIFTRKFRVRYSELDPNGWVAPANYLNYLVETAYDWGTANQLGMAESEAMTLAWVIRETEMDILCPLRFNDVFDFTIWLMEWRRVRGTRGFKITLNDTGELVARGAQKVVSLDAKNMRPVTPPTYLLDAFQLENPPKIPLHPFKKETLNQDGVLKTQRRIERRDIDTLDIVYNTVYAHYAEEAFRQLLERKGWSPERLKEQGVTFVMQNFHIKYFSPARWSDVLGIETYITGLGESSLDAYLRMVNQDTGDGIVNMRATWGSVDLVRGGKRPLDRELRKSLQYD
jgi:YbgC/YbaW family acyl-CoA thioester hydrolase